MNPNAVAFLIVSFAFILLTIYPGVLLAYAERFPVVIRREASDDGYKWSITFQRLYRPRTKVIEE